MPQVLRSIQILSQCESSAGLGRLQSLTSCFSNRYHPVIRRGLVSSSSNLPPGTLGLPLFSATPELVLEAIKRTKTDLKVYLGIVCFAL